MAAYLPEFPDFGHKITLRHLLSHSSGLRDWGGLVLMAGGRMDDIVTSRDILKLIFRQRELHFEPGTAFSYCNAGYVLLAEVVARAAGQSFREWTRANIFLPLAMERTSFRDDVGEFIPGLARSYRRSAGGRFSLAPDNDAEPGPGSLILSVEDLARWLAALETRAAAPAETWAKMFARGRLADGREVPYSAGLIVGRYKESQVFYHSGRWSGFRSGMIFFPEHHLSVAVLTNNSSIDAAQFSRRISEIYLEGQFIRPQPPPPAFAVESSALDSCVGRYWFKGEQTIEIKRQGNHLYAQMSGGLPVEIFAESTDTFAYRIADAKIQFHRDSSGKVLRLTYWQEAAAIPAERLPDEKWSPSGLAEFCGRYVSDELDVVLEVKEGEKGLFIPYIRNADLVLSPVAKDRFGGRDSSAKFSFQRGTDGRITELRFSLLDARNVRFVRMQDG